MKHKEFAAATTPTTDLGEFQALISTADRDREGDVVMPGAFGASIAEWQASGKQLPLHWDHQGDPEAIVGEVDPQSMVETADGLVVEGALDLDTEWGKQVWKLIKANRVGFSFGFLMGKSRVRSDGVREIHEVDVFEVSVTARPANPNTRVLATKNGDVTDPHGLRDLALAIGAAFDEAEAEHKAAANRSRRPSRDEADRSRLQPSRSSGDPATPAGLRLRGPPPWFERRGIRSPGRRGIARAGLGGGRWSRGPRAEHRSHAPSLEAAQ
jgi:uncharacterized protein